MKLSQIQTTRSATIDLGNGQSFEIKFRSLSPIEWDELEAKTRNQKWPLIEQLSHLLVETGLEDNDGNPMPATEEGLKMIELPILKAMMTAIWNVTLPKKAT